MDCAELSQAGTSSLYFIIYFTRLPGPQPLQAQLAISSHSQSLTASSVARNGRPLSEGDL